MLLLACICTLTLTVKVVTVSTRLCIKYVFAFIRSLDVISISRPILFSLWSYVRDEKNVNWGTGILFQEDAGKILKQLSRHNNKNQIKSTCEVVENILKNYHDAIVLSKTIHAILKRLISRSNLSKLLQEQQEQWHQSCKSKVTNSNFHW